MFMDKCAFAMPGLEVIKLEYSLKLRMKHNDWLLAEIMPLDTDTAYRIDPYKNKWFIGIYKKIKIV